MAPIATYREVRHDGKQTYALYEDMLTIEGHRLWGVELALRIPLEEISPVTSTIKTRAKEFYWAVVYLCGAIPSLDSGAFTEHGPGFDLWDTWGLIIFFGALVAAVVVLATFRWTEWIVLGTTGSRGSLMIARLGPDKKHLEEFVGKLLVRIEARRRVVDSERKVNDASVNVQDPERGE